MNCNHKRTIALLLLAALLLPTASAAAPKRERAPWPLDVWALDPDEGIGDSFWGISTEFTAKEKETLSKIAPVTAPCNVWQTINRLSTRWLTAAFEKNYIDRCFIFDFESAVEFLINYYDEDVVGTDAIGVVIYGEPAAIYHVADSHPKVSFRDSGGNVKTTVTADFTSTNSNKNTYKNLVFSGMGNISGVGYYYVVYDGDNGITFRSKSGSTNEEWINAMYNTWSAWGEKMTGTNGICYSGSFDNKTDWPVHPCETLFEHQKLGTGKTVNGTILPANSVSVVKLVPVGSGTAISGSVRSGNYTILNVPTGDYKLEAMPRGNFARYSRSVSITTDSTFNITMSALPDPREAERARSGALEVFVDSAGTLQLLKAGGTVQSKSMVAGKNTIPDLQVGAYTVTFGSEVRSGVQILAGKTTKITFGGATTVSDKTGILVINLQSLVAAGTIDNAAAVSEVLVDGTKYNNVKRFDSYRIVLYGLEKGKAYKVKVKFKSGSELKEKELTVTNEVPNTEIDGLPSIYG